MGRFTTAVAAYAANVDNLPNKDKLPEVSLWEAVLPTSLSDLVGKAGPKKQVDGEKKDGVEKVEKVDVRKGEEKVSHTVLGWVGLVFRTTWNEMRSHATNLTSHPIPTSLRMHRPNHSASHVTITFLLNPKQPFCSTNTSSPLPTPPSLLI